MLSPEDAQIVVDIERACSALSLIGCLFVMITFSLSDAFRQRSINRLVFLATIGNLLTNVATLMTTSYIGASEGVGCQMQGFLIQVFMQGDAYWALAMAINVYLTFYRKYDARQLRKMEIPYVLCCYGIPLIPGLTFIFVRTEHAGRPYGDAVLWCWLKSEWEVYRIATFYGPIWVAILVSISIYTFVGRQIWLTRQKMLNFSSTGTGTAVGNEPFSPQHEFSPAFNFKTTEVTQTTEIIQPLAPAAKSGTIPPGSKAGAYSVTISTDARAANELNMRASLENTDINDAATGTATLTTLVNSGRPVPSTTTKTSATTKRARIMSTQISIAPTVTATITTNHGGHPLPSSRRRNFESHNAAWAYTKCAILFFSVLLITWIPSSGNRVYSLVHGGEVSKPLFIASAFVLPLQGFWNAIIYIVTSWAACKSLWGYCMAGLAGWRDWGWVRWVMCKGGRRVSLVEVLDQRRNGGGRGTGGRVNHNASRVGIWMGAGARVRKERESESTSMEDLTGEGRAERVSPV